MKQLFISNMLLLAVLSACTKKEDDRVSDTVRPRILQHRLESDQVLAGSTLTVDVTFSDDQALGQAKLEIHDDFDGHHHGRVQAPFSWDLVLDLQAKMTYVRRLEVPVPADASSGLYHFSILITDKSGNESAVSVLEFQISHSGQPIVTLTSPDPGEVLTVTSGQVISLSGTVTDDRDLASIHVSIVPEEAGPEVFEKMVQLSGGTDLNYDLAGFQSQHEVVVPADAESGAYELLIRAVDSDQNNTTVHVELLIN